MLKICITNLSVETIQTLGSINIGKTIISQNQASAAVLPVPSPAAPVPDQETTASVPAPGQVFVPPAEVSPGVPGISVPSQVPVSPAVVSPGQVGGGVGGGVGGVGGLGAS